MSARPGLDWGHDRYLNPPACRYLPSAMRSQGSDKAQRKRLSASGTSPLHDVYLSCATLQTKASPTKLWGSQKQSEEFYFAAFSDVAPSTALTAVIRETARKAWPVRPWPRRSLGLWLAHLWPMCPRASLSQCSASSLPAATPGDILSKWYPFWEKPTSRVRQTWAWFSVLTRYPFWTWGSESALPESLVPFCLGYRVSLWLIPEKDHLENRT